MSHDSPIIVSRGPNCAQFRKPSASLSRVGGGGRRARANGIVESVERRRARERSVAWGERERERERDERTIDRSVESISIINHRNRRSDRSRGEGWILGEG